MAWSGSTRSARLPRDWAKRRRAVKKRAGGLCEAANHVEASAYVEGCDGIGTECDHIINNDDHSLTNLQWLSTPCHLAKTLTEATEARGRVARKRTTPPHPGHVDT